MLEIFQNLFSPPRHMILLILAAWLGLSLAERYAEKHSISKDDLNNITFYSLIAFVIGGRVSYILQNIPAFAKSPLGVISINPDLFDPFGALVVAAITALIYGQRKGLAFWNTLDALTPFFSVLTIGLGLSHLAAGTSFGQPTDLPWGIEMWNAIRHPTQLYETLASLLTLGLLLRFKANHRPGLLFLIFASLTALYQLFIQAFRGDSALIFNTFRQGQILAWIALVICFASLESILTPTKQRSIPESKSRTE